MLPRVGESRGPSPSDSTPMDASIAPDTAATKLASAYGARFGIISLNMIPIGDVPDILAISTYPRSRMTSTCDRMTLAGPGHASTAMTNPSWSTVSPFPGFNDVATSTSMSSPGMGIRLSTIVLMTASTHPPAYAATKARTMPTPTPMAAAISPIRNDRGIPTTTAANMSLPCSSVPNGYPLQGFHDGVCLAGTDIALTSPFTPCVSPSRSTLE